MVSDEEKQFYERRNKLSRIWPYMAFLLLAMLSGLSVYFYYYQPKLINRGIPMRVRNNIGGLQTIVEI